MISISSVANPEAQVMGSKKHELFLQASKKYSYQALYYSNLSSFDNSGRMVEASESPHIRFEYFLGSDFNDDTKKLSESTDFTAASEASLSGELTDDVIYSVEEMTQIMV